MEELLYAKDRPCVNFENRELSAVIEIPIYLLTYNLIEYVRLVEIGLNYFDLPV
jgi:hypothetical protein